MRTDPPAVTRKNRTAVVQLACEAFVFLDMFSPYISGAASTTNTLYIKMKNAPGTLRISDHPTSAGFECTWNITIGGVDKLEEGRYYATELSYKRFLDYMVTELLRNAS